jgi:hypothetical protein
MFTIIGAALAITAICARATWKSTQPLSAAASQQSSKLELEQIPEAAITKAEIAPIGPHGTLRLSVRNDSKKAIDGVIVSIITEVSKVTGGTFKMQSWHVANRSIHPDIGAMHQHGKHAHPVLPGEEVSVITNEQIVLDEGFVALQKITARIAYLRFVDGSTIGDERRGRMLSDVTIGAEKYKRWLVAKYLAAGKSQAVLASLLKEPKLPSDLDIPPGGSERTGAFLYRNHLRRALRDRTINVDEILK